MITPPLNAACVLASGPEETDGDGSYEYTVCFGDNDGEPITHNRSQLWRLWDYDDTFNFGQRLASQTRLEFVNDAMPA